MAPLPSAELDVLLGQVQQRLIESGEWDRLMLAAKLNDSGWIDDLHNRSKESARGMHPPAFTKVLDEALSIAITHVPLTAKREITALIKGFLDKQFE